MQEPWNTQETWNTENHKTPTADDRPAPSSIPGGRDIHLVLGGIAWVWTFCALATFSSKDSSFFHVVLPLEAVRNWCGSFGAHMAAILYVFFGMAAWSFLLLGLWAVPLRSWQTARRLKSRIISFSFWMLSSATLLQMLGYALLAPTPGGMLGAAGLLVESFVGTVGCVLAYVMVSTVSFLNVIQVSYATAWQATRWGINTALSASLSAIRKTFKLIFAQSSQLWARGNEKKEAPLSSPLVGDPELTIKELDSGRSQNDNSLDHELPPVEPIAPSRDPQDIIIDEVAEAGAVETAAGEAVPFTVEEAPFSIEAADGHDLYGDDEADDVTGSSAAEDEETAIAIGDEVHDTELPYELEDGKDVGDDYPTNREFSPAADSLSRTGSGDEFGGIEREPTASELEEIDEDEVDELLEEVVIDEADESDDKEGSYFTGEENEGEANDAEWHAAPTQDEDEAITEPSDDIDDDDDDDDDSDGGSDGGGYFMPGNEVDSMSVTPATSGVQEAEISFSGSSTSEDDKGREQPEPVVEEEEEPEPAVYKAPEPFELPSIDIFAQPEENHADEEAFHQVCEERARVLTTKLAHFGINGRVAGIHPGPVITLFEYEPEVGSKVSKILALEDDLALSLRALSIRIIAPVPGKNVVGFEIANEDRKSVMFSEVASENRLTESDLNLPLSLGVDITGEPVVNDLSKMPHLLVAGATGAGKSVGMNVMLVSLLCSRTPDQMRLILVDPKRLEFAPYADIPHLLFPIVTNPHEVSPVLKWVVQEMEQRYEVMAQAGVRNIADYHKLDVEDRFALEDELGVDLNGMPYIVIMVDELADLMMVVGKEVEGLIARIAQMARAAGIHMIVATQRPSVDVVTGIIKVNFPSRVAFRVSTKIDSRTIIDGSGAEKLLGKGDMLFMSPNAASLQRMHGAYVTDEEVTELTDYLKEQREVEYFSLQQIIAKHSDASKNDEKEDDPLYGEVRDFLDTVDEVSISLLQRKYRVGFNRSARLIEMLERDGCIAPAQGSKPRRVLRD